MAGRNARKRGAKHGFAIKRNGGIANDKNSAEKLRKIKNSNKRLEVFVFKFLMRQK
jgi:hypothetical protein